LNGDSLEALNVPVSMMNNHPPNIFTQPDDMYGDIENLPGAYKNGGSGLSKT